MALWSSGPAARFGEAMVLGEDPDGLKFALVVPAGGDERAPWVDGGIDPALAIRGFHGVTLDLADHAPTAALLEGLLDYQPAGAGGRHPPLRYRATPAMRSIVDIVAAARRRARSAGPRQRPSHRVRGRRPGGAEARCASA